MRDTIALALVRAELCRARTEAQRRAARMPRRAGGGRILLLAVQRVLGVATGRGSGQGRSPDSSISG